METIIPKLAAGMAASAIVVAIYAQLFWLHRQPFLGVWALAWSAYLARNILAFWLPPQFSGQHAVIWVYAVLAVFAAWCLLAGSRLFVGRPTPRWAAPLLAGGVLWGVAAQAMGLSFVAQALPGVAVTAAAQTLAGHTLWRAENLDRPSRRLAGGALMAWGVGHIFVVTMLRPWLPEYFVWGLLSGAICEVVSAITMLVLFYQQTHAELIASRRGMAENQNRLLAALANLPLMVYAFDEAGRPIIWNKAAEALTGFSGREVGSARQALDLLIPDQGQRETVFAGAGRAISAELCIAHKDGGRRFAAWSDIAGLAPIQGWRAWGVASDVTASREAAQNLRRQSDFIAAVLDNASALIVVFDVSGKVVRFNRACQRVTGFGPDQVLGRPVWDTLIPPERVEAVQALFSSFIPEDMPGQLERQWLTADGGRVDIVWSLAHLAGEDGKIGHVVASGVDVTEQRRAEQALRQSELFHRTLLENMPDGMVLSDIVTSEVLYANPAAGAILGYGQAELLGMLGHMFHPPDQRERLLPIIDGIRLGRCSQAHGLPFMRKDGSIIHCDLAAAHIELDGVSCLMWFFRDSSERTAAQERVRQVAAGVAHNFNNLLMAVISNAQALGDVLEAGAGQGRERRLLENVAKAAVDGQDMVRRLEAFLVSGLPTKARDEALNLAEVVRTAMDLTLSLPAAKVGVIFDVTVDEAVHVSGSRGELVEVLLNIIKNALDALDGHGELAITGLAKGDMAELTISDNGPGIDQQAMARLFEPFFSTKGVRGKGLGLASSQGIIKAHGGQVRVESLPGQRTSFIITLPLARPPAPPTAVAAPPSAVADPPPPPGRRDILLVEDEALVAMGAEAVLSAAGHRVRHAAGVEQARRALAQRAPDLVLCDLGLPDGDAWDVARALALADAAAGRQATPLLIITGWNMEHPGMARPPDLPPPRQIIRKPVDKAMLLRAVDQA